MVVVTSLLLAEPKVPLAAAHSAAETVWAVRWSAERM